MHTARQETSTTVCYDRVPRLPGVAQRSARRVAGRFRNSGVRGRREWRGNAWSIFSKHLRYSRSVRANESGGAARTLNVNLQP